MGERAMVLLGDLLTRVKRPIEVQEHGSYPAVSVQKEGRGLGDKEPFVGGVTKYETLHVVRENDVVLRTITAFESPVAVAGSAHDGFHVSTGAFITYEVDGRRVLPAFLAVVFQTTAFWRQMQSRATGTVIRRKTISDKAFRTIEIPLLDLDEQHRVVEASATFDRMIEATAAELEAVRRTLHSRRAEIFTAPWPTVPLGEILAPERNEVLVSPDETYAEIGVRSHGRGVFEKAKIAGTALGDKKVFEMEPGALVVNIVFAWEGAVAKVPEHLAGRVASHRFPNYVRPDSGSIDYVRHWLLSPAGLTSLRLASPGGAGRNRTLSRSRFLSERIPCPERETQQRVAVELNGWEALGKSVEAELLAATRLRNATIERLVTGRARVVAA